MFCCLIYSAFEVEGCTPVKDGQWVGTPCTEQIVDGSYSAIEGKPLSLKGPDALDIANEKSMVSVLGEAKRLKEDKASAQEREYVLQDLNEVCQEWVKQSARRLSESGELARAALRLRLVQARRALCGQRRGPAVRGPALPDVPHVLRRARRDAGVERVHQQLLRGARRVRAGDELQVQVDRHRTGTSTTTPTCATSTPSWCWRSTACAWRTRFSRSCPTRTCSA